MSRLLAALLALPLLIASALIGVPASAAPGESITVTVVAIWMATARRVALDTTAVQGIEVQVTDSAGAAIPTHRQMPPDRPRSTSRRAPDRTGYQHDSARACRRRVAGARAGHRGPGETPYASLVTFVDLAGGDSGDLVQAVWTTDRWRSALQLGDRVWWDTDRDGIQDPGRARRSGCQGRRWSTMRATCSPTTLPVRRASTSSSVRRSRRGGGDSSWIRLLAPWRPPTIRQACSNSIGRRRTPAPTSDCSRRRRQCRTTTARSPRRSPTGRGGDPDGGCRTVRGSGTARSRSTRCSMALTFAELVPGAEFEFTITTDSGQRAGHGERGHRLAVRLGRPRRGEAGHHHRVQPRRCAAVRVGMGRPAAARGPWLERPECVVRDRGWRQHIL